LKLWNLRLKSTILQTFRVEALKIDTNFLIKQNIAFVGENNYDLSSYEKLFDKSLMTFEQERIYNIRSQIVLELLNSEKKIEDIVIERSNNIDLKIIDMLQRRVITAEWISDNETGDVIILLAERLKVGLIKFACSPVLNLLNHSLKILIPLTDINENREVEVYANQILNTVD